MDVPLKEKKIITPVSKGHPPLPPPKSPYVHLKPDCILELKAWELKCLEGTSSEFFSDFHRSLFSRLASPKVESEEG